jgi:hypothetical protein
MLRVITVIGFPGVVGFASAAVVIAGTTNMLNAVAATANLVGIERIRSLMVNPSLVRSCADL